MKRSAKEKEYQNIRESLELILRKECPEKSKAILDSLDDAIINNWEKL